MRALLTLWRCGSISVWWPAPYTTQQTQNTHEMSLAGVTSSTVFFGAIVGTTPGYWAASQTVLSKLNTTQFGEKVLAGATNDVVGCPFVTASTTYPKTANTWWIYYQVCI